MKEFRLIQGGRQTVHSHGVAGQVRDRFGDCPHLADFLEQCLELLEQQRWPPFDAEIGAVTLSELEVAEILVNMRQDLVQRFGRRIKAGEEWVHVLADVDPGRARVLFGAFMPFAQQKELVVAMRAPEFGWMREYVAAVKSSALKKLALGQKGVEERRARELLLHIYVLTIMVASPQHPCAVVDDAHRFGNFVDILLGDEKIVDVAPDFVPLPGQVATTTYVSRRVPPVPLHFPPPQLCVVK